MPDLYDKRLAALQDTRAKLDSSPSWRDAPSGPSTGDVLKALAPLAAAYLADMATTQDFVGRTDKLADGRTVHINEANPLPGFGKPGLGGAAIRVGAYGPLEMALVGLAMKKSPKLGKMLRNSMMAKHTDLALSNQRRLDSMRMMDSGRLQEPPEGSRMSTLKFVLGGE